MDNKVSCIAAAESAFKRTGKMLFKPFEWKYWFLLSLGAWLALLGEGLPWPSFTDNQTGLDPILLQQGFTDAAHGNWSTLLSALGITIGIKMLVLIIIAALFLFLLWQIFVIWVKDQGNFMYLEFIFKKDADVKQTFKTHLHLGNSAFLWEFWLVIISVILTVVAFALPLILSLPWAKTCLEQTTLTCPDTTAICGFVLSFCCGLATLLVTSVIFFYFYQFIVPIMYLCKIKALQATGIFWNLFITKPLVFVKYLILIVILKLCLSVAIVLALIVLLLITCCLAAIPLAILYVLLFLPYVWVTLLLPMLVFFRLCGLELLNQIYKNQDLAIWAEESHQENNNADPEDIQAS